MDYPVFKEARAQTEKRVMVQLLSEVEQNPGFTQRSLAQELGIALGLMNQYLRRCVSCGWIRAKQVSPKRWSYFLTKKGFLEKSTMVREYLSRSMSLFREARQDCETIYAHCESQGWLKIAVLGRGDLSDVAGWVALGSAIQVYPIESLSNLKPKQYDAVLITDMHEPQTVYDKLVKILPKARVFVLQVLRVSQKGTN